jgi:hypothetical protein
MGLLDNFRSPASLKGGLTSGRRTPQTSRNLGRKPIARIWTTWPDSVGMGGRIKLESVAAFDWNQWPDSVGMRSQSESSQPATADRYATKPSHGFFRFNVEHQARAQSPNVAWCESAEAWRMSRWAEFVGGLEGSDMFLECAAGSAQSRELQLLRRFGPKRLSP